MYTYPWPQGTIHSTELPPNLLAELLKRVDSDGVLLQDELIVIQKTATEGPFFSWGGYKVRVTIESTSPTTYIARLA